MAVPEEYGGGGVDDFRFNVVLAEELARAGIGGAGLGLTLHNDITHARTSSPTATHEQQARWLPGIASGELITAVAMTEPGIGSDLASMTTTAIRDGDDYVVNGSKTFITNGINADLVDHRREDRPDPEAQGHEPARHRAGHGRASSAAATSTRSACTARTPPSCSSTTCASRSPTSSARRARASRYLVAQPGPGAALDRRHRRGHGAARPWRGRSTT